MDTNSHQDLSLVLVRDVTPILNVSDITSTFAWFEKWNWRKAWEWSTPARFGSVERDGCEIFVCQGAQGSKGRGSNSRTFGPLGEQTSDHGVGWWSGSTIWIRCMSAASESS